MSSDEYFLSLCIQEAWKYQSLTLPNPAVGAMVLDNLGNILSLSAHTKAGMPHAEVNALKLAYEKLSQKKCDLLDSNEIHQFLKNNHNGVFKDCSIYVTLEPCNHYGKTPPCAELLEIIKPKRIIVGSEEIIQEASGGIQRLQNNSIEIKRGVLKKQCDDLLYPFLCYKQKGHFNLFKLAQRLNGDYKSGLISSKESQEFTHNQRSIADCIVISGKTLRTDNPRLDTRYATKDYISKAPNIKILTTKEPINNLALFDTPHRKVEFCSKPKDLDLQAGFNIIEGGWDLFEGLESFVDMLLLHISPTLKQNTQTKGFAWQGSLLYTQKIGNDVLLWIKKS